MSGIRKTDGELGALVESYVRHDYNSSVAAREMGAHRATVRRAVELWLSGELKVQRHPRPKNGEDPRNKSIERSVIAEKPPVIPVEPAEVRRLKNDLKRVREERDQLLAAQELNNKLADYFKFIKEATHGSRE